jgi:hypothetical protein
MSPVLLERLRHAGEEAVQLASQLAASGARWSNTLVTDARKLLTDIGYFEQEQRRLQAEANRQLDLPHHAQVQALPAHTEEK